MASCSVRIAVIQEPRFEGRYCPGMAVQVALWPR
jgi:hypothetical protein